MIVCACMLLFCPPLYAVLASADTTLLTSFMDMSWTYSVKFILHLLSGSSSVIKADVAWGAIFVTVLVIDVTSHSKEQTQLSSYLLGYGGEEDQETRMELAVALILSWSLVSTETAKQNQKK